MNAELVAIVLCLAGSAFFSASETALTSLPVTRREALRETSGRLTRAALDRWAQAPQELLITILVGNNLVNVLASSLATTLAYRLVQSSAVAVAVGVITLFILVFGEITPKTLAQRHAQWVVAKVAPVLYLLDLVLRPVNAVLGLLARALSPRTPQEVPVTEEDLLFMLRLAHRHAQLPREARHVIESVLRFQQATARQIMVPRPRVETVDASWDDVRLRAVVGQSPHSRFPVVDGSPDRIVGVLHARHLLRLAPGSRWTDTVVDAIFIPESKPLPDLLQDMRHGGQHLAIVLDEFGGFSGIVSLEDILELVFGEIEDELDRELGTTVVTEGDGWLVPGYLALRRLERILHRSLPAPEGIDSVGGLVGSLVETEVEVGEVVHWAGLALEVRDVDGGRATRLHVRSAPLG